MHHYEDNALVYDDFTFFSTGGHDRFGECLLSAGAFNIIFVSIDSAPAKRLSDLKWDDFGQPGGELVIHGTSARGRVTLGQTDFSFANANLDYANLGSSDRLRFSSFEKGPFIKIPASRKQIENAFGKPAKTGFSNWHAP